MEGTHRTDDAVPPAMAKRWVPVKHNNGGAWAWTWQQLQGRVLVAAKPPRLVRLHMYYASAGVAIYFHHDVTGTEGIGGNTNVPAGACRGCCHQPCLRRLASP